MTMAESKQCKNGDERLTLDEMKSFLWNAATHLRGQIDATGYKEFIFPLLFFKRISDVYDEQYSGFVAEGEGDYEYANEQMREMPIQIPEGSHWNDVRQVTEDVGQALVNAFTAIERANPPRIENGRRVGGLTGIFGPKGDWTNKAKMPDEIILSLIEDFSKHTLSLASCPADEMGQAYEYLIGKFADDAGHTAQEFYTNRTIVELMAELLQLQPDESLYDPTCGSGGMLVKSLDYLRKQDHEWRGVKVFGQELDAITSSIARMNLFLNGVTDFSIEVGDTLAAPAFLEGSQLRTFDMVLANPPYSIKSWNRTAFENDKFGRNFLGVPPQGRADYAFIQHILKSMDPRTGRCAILLPHGVLFRKEEEEIRRNLIKADLLEAVIGMGPNLFFNSPMEACILVCRSQKPEELKNKVIFINALKEVTRKNGESYLEPEHIAKILSAYRERKVEDKFSTITFTEDIAGNNYNLNIPLYVNALEGEYVSDVLSKEEAYATWMEQHESVMNIFSTLNNLLSHEVE